MTIHRARFMGRVQLEELVLLEEVVWRSGEVVWRAEGAVWALMMISRREISGLGLPRVESQVLTVCDIDS